MAVEVCNHQLSRHCCTLYIAGVSPGEISGRTADAVLVAGIEKRNACADVGFVILSGGPGRHTAGEVVEIVVHAEAGSAAQVGAVGVAFGTRNPVVEATGIGMEMARMRKKAGVDGASKSKPVVVLVVGGVLADETHQ